MRYYTLNEQGEIYRLIPVSYTHLDVYKRQVLTGDFEEGDIVEEGIVLYTVDSSDATTKVEQAAITLQQRCV